MATWKIKKDSSGIHIIDMCTGEKLYRLHDTHLNFAEWWVDDHNKLVAKLEMCETALREITKGRGAYSRDQLTHASNTIEDLKGLAQAALDIVFVNEGQ